MTISPRRVAVARWWRMEKEGALARSAPSFRLLCRCCLFFVGALSTPEKDELCVPFVAVVYGE